MNDQPVPAPVSPPPDPLPQPPVIDSDSQPTVQVQSMVVSQPPSQPVRNNGHKLLLALILLIIIVGGSIYFYFVPSSQAKTYTKAIKQPYNQQVLAVNAAINSFKLPVFEKNDTVQAADDQDYTAARTAITTAQTATTQLTASNKLNMLPLTSLLPAAKKAQNQHKQVAAHIKASQTFLNDYQATVTYMDESETLGNSVMPPLEDAINNLTFNANRTQFDAQLTTDIGLAQAASKAFGPLKPSHDFAAFQTTLVTSLNNLISGLQNLKTGVDTSNLAETGSAGTKIGQAITDIVNLDKDSAAIINSLHTKSQLQTEVNVLIPPVTPY